MVHTKRNLSILKEHCLLQQLMGKAAMVCMQHPCASANFDHQDDVTMLWVQAAHLQLRSRLQYVCHGT